MGCGQSRSGAESALEALAYRLDGVSSADERQKIYNNWTLTNALYDRQLTTLHAKSPLQVVEERMEKKRKQEEEEAAASGSGADVKGMSLHEIRDALLAKYEQQQV